MQSSTRVADDGKNKVGMTYMKERIKMKHLGDVTKINGAEIEPVDCISFGSPCQDLSCAGKRAGLDGERSGLFMDAIRVIKEMRNHGLEQLRRSGRADEPIRPRYALWENVPGALSSNNGEDFRVVLEEFARIKEDGVSIPRPLDAKGRIVKWAKSGCINGGAMARMFGRLRGESWMPNFMEYPKEEVESQLSWILMEEVLPKYFLSKKACQGILNRASKRGKGLPEILKNALMDVVQNAL